MERALPLVASFFSSCKGGHRPPSMPAADRLHSDTCAMGTPVVPGHVVRVWSNDRGSHTRHRILDLSSEAAWQCAMVRADVAPVQVAWLAVALPGAQFPAMPGELSPDWIRSNVLMRGERVSEVTARSQPSLFLLQGSTENTS